MTCEEMALALVSDDPVDREKLEAHAEKCQVCAELLEADRRLAENVQNWTASTPAPALDLERRIRAVIEADAAGAEAPYTPAIGIDPAASGDKARTGGHRWRWIAAAAVLVVALAGLSVVFERPWLRGTPPSPLELAVQRVEAAERDYIEAIAVLERQTAEVLARSGDPTLPPDKANILISYRDRLAHLDTVIADVGSFLGENPGHTGGHTVLLAAYKEKEEVMREVLQLDLGVSS